MRDNPIITRLTAAAALLLVFVALALMWPGLATAQQQGPIPGTTPETACGAPGIGAVRIGSVIELQPGPFAGQRVDAGGLWVSCAMPVTPDRAATDCPAMPELRTWTVGGNTCATSGGSTADSPARDRTLRDGESGWWRQVVGPMRGSLVERCTDGRRTVTEATCAPATHCDMAWWTERSGKRYSIAAGGSAGVPVGQYATATAPDGSTLRIQCVAGAFEPRPQCVAPLEVRQIYTRSTRVYRYAGPPLEPGQRVLLTQVSGDRKPDGSPRTLWAACTSGGVLQ